MIPAPIMALLSRYLEFRIRQRLRRCATVKDAFTMIYEAGLWEQSNEPEEEYYSGSGSHRAEIVDTYVSSVNGFLQSFSKKPDAVDLGCGDFAIGAQIRPYCGRYIAVDVVDGLIERNKKKFANDDIDFRAMEIINDELPSGDVVFLRQVLQHLTNSEISKVVAKLPSKFRFLVLTEHLPFYESFVPNLDNGHSRDIRLQNRKSGIVLTEPPFNLKVSQSSLLCEVYEDCGLRKGVIRTILYQF
jgi:hypothetical protein